MECDEANLLWTIGRGHCTKLRESRLVPVCVCDCYLTACPAKDVVRSVLLVADRSMYDPDRCAVLLRHVSNSMPYHCSM